MIIGLLVTLQLFLAVYSFMYQRCVLVLSSLITDKFDPEESRTFLTPYPIHIMSWFVNFFGLFVSYITWRETTWYIALIVLLVPFLIAGRWPLPYSYFFQKIIKNLVEREKKLSFVSDYKEKVYALEMIETLQERLAIKTKKWPTK